MMIITTAILSIATIITFYIVYRWIQLQPYNSQPLDIRTYDGFNSPYHPSVLYFEAGWNGYKYWMVETPFSPKCKPYRDRNECPSIHVSDNGINWKEIISNPIDYLNEQEIEELDYFSDPHLVYANGRLECWYRFTHREGFENKFNNLQLARKYSYDGVNWSEREIMVNLPAKEGDPLGNMVVSPAIIYENSKYRMWYVDSESRGNRNLSYSESTDGRKWKKKADCTLQGLVTNPWHIDVNYIDGRYIMLCYDFNNLTLWESKDGINFTFTKEVLKPSVIGSFYGYSLYRACIIKDEEYKIYFSSNDSFCTYIGLVAGNNLNDLHFVIEGKRNSILGLAKQLFKHECNSILFITKQLLREINH